MTSWVEGRIEKILWARADGGWAVLRLLTSDGPVMVVGPLGLLPNAEQSFASFEGAFERHPSHGHQFKASGVLLGSPRTAEGMREYLSHGIEGVGPGMAARIVARFGERTTTILEKQPELLAQVPGLGKKRAEAIRAAWEADAGARSLSILLQGLGLSPRLVQRIRERYGERAWEVVTTTPYRLAEDVGGIGFLTADKLALGQGVAPDDPARVGAAMLHVLSRASDEGHCFLPWTEAEAALRRLDVPVDRLEEAVGDLLARVRLLDVGTPEVRRLALPELARHEEHVAYTLRERALASAGRLPTDHELAEAERWAGVQLDATQQHAIRVGLSTALAVITGGPGTGKTTLVRVLLRLAEARGETWALASPTGRAAKRLAEATGKPASTIHRLLEFQPGGGGFQKNPSEPLDVDGLVVDETSMVDVGLMTAVLDALPTDRPTRLLLVGDADQLPSVGPGQVLRDLVDSAAIPVARLATVHRQAARSGIVVGAAAVHAGRVPESGERTGHDDFFVVPREEPEVVIGTVLEIVTRRLVSKGFDPIEDVQVLAPTRKGPLGVGALNDALREALNPNVRAWGEAGRFAVGDKVLCTKNRYDFGVFNGDLGRVADVTPNTTTIRFDEGDVVWPREDLDQIDLAYAVTVHKSQGSEYPAVVLVLHPSHSVMLRRNLLYTAMTRARRFFCVVGPPGALARAVREQRGDQRFTRLRELLAHEEVV